MVIGQGEALLQIGTPCIVGYTDRILFLLTDIRDYFGNWSTVICLTWWFQQQRYTS